MTLRYYFSSFLKKGNVAEVAAAAASVLLLSTAGAWAATPATPETAVHLLFTIPVPVAPSNTTGGMYGFDISFVDQTSQDYFLGDRSNAAVDEVDASGGTFLRQITASPPFAGATGDNSTSGPNGVATDGTGTCLFAGDGPSRVVSFKLPSGKQVSDVKTGGTLRADEMAFDPKDRILIVANNADTPPFATLISVNANCKLKIGKRITITASTNGAEQAAWDPGTQRFYMSIPSTTGTIASPGPLGAIARINPKTATIEAMLPVSFCMPAGLSLGPNSTFLAGCSVVYDLIGEPWFGADPYSAYPVQVVIDVNGNFQYVPGVGSSDEVWYNAGDNHWYTGSQNSPYSPHPVAGTGGGLSTTDQGAGILGAIDGTSQDLDQIVPTIDVPAVKGVHVSGSSHSVAANASNSWVFVPHPANNAVLGCLTGCIGVYGRKDVDLIGAND